MNAFADRPGDSAQVVLYHRNDRFGLPDSAGQRGSYTYRELAESLAAMPVRLIEWHKFSRITLYAGDLRAEAPSRLRERLAEIPALAHLEVETYFLEEQVHFLPDGTVVTGEVTDLPKGTLSLAAPAREGQ